MTEKEIIMKYLFLTDNAGVTNPNDILPVLILVIGLFAFTIVMPMITNKKRRKQMMEMMDAMKVGDRIKTIGGMVGAITSIDAEAGLFVINVGTEENPTYVTIDKTAVYPLNVMPEPAVEEGIEDAEATEGEPFNEENAKAEESAEAVEVVEAEVESEIKE